MKFYSILNWLLILLFFSYEVIVIAQNRVPVVQNVKFSQRTDGSFAVDIYYDVNDPDGNTMTVNMKVSDDNGANWDFPSKITSGDLGSGISSGQNKHIVWDFGGEHPETFGDKFKIKIIADDGIGGTGLGKPCPGLPQITDSRDGRVYNTVLIGDDQCWLRENINIGTKINSNGYDSQTNNGVLEKYCYNNLEANCDKYGGLYEWNEAMQYSSTEKTRGICPQGWHLPTAAELGTLANIVGQNASALLAIGQGNGTNTSGFSALFAGTRNSTNGSFYYLGSSTYFWSSTEDNSYNAYNMYLNYNYSSILLFYYNKDYGFSVRCLKD